MSAMAGHAPIVIPAGAGYTRADVEFMQGMIAHAQLDSLNAGTAPRSTGPT